MCEIMIAKDESITPVGIRDGLLEQITQPEIPVDLDCVRVMSLHKSKGLTGKLVIILGFAEGMIPFVSPGLTPAEETRRMQEQRRLFFVALTRATNYLVLSSAKLLRAGEAAQMGLNLPSHGLHWRRTSPSQFATQLGPSCPTAAIDGDEWLGQLGIGRDL
jgi:superfamily I DNA/RNA helicase